MQNNVTLIDRPGRKAICGEKYELAVNAINGAGNGPYSAPKTGYCGFHELKVRDLKVAEIGSNWAEIIWNHPLLYGNVFKGGIAHERFNQV